MPTKKIPEYNSPDSQIGITNEQAIMWWGSDELRTKFISQNKKYKKYDTSTYNILPVKLKNEFKKWLTTAKRGVKISNNSEHRGGKLSGKYHTNGGIKAVIRETGKPVEVENEELIITKGVAQSEDVVVCHGKPEAIASDLNVKYGGDKISDKIGRCSIIKKHIMKKGKKIKYNKGVKLQNDPKYKIGDIVKFKYEDEIAEGEITTISVLDNEYIYEVDTNYIGGVAGNEPALNDVAESEIVEVFGKKGSKIKSHIDNRKIERMIIRENELKRADNGIKVQGDDDEQAALERQQKNEYILITEPEVYAIMQFADNIEFHEYERAVPQFSFRGNEVNVYKYDQHLVDFLNKWGIHYRVYEHRTELIEYLKSFLPSRLKNQIQ